MRTRQRWSAASERAAHWAHRVDDILTWKRARTYAFVLIALYVVAYAWVLWQGHPPLNASGEPIGGDFIAFQSAARLVVSGHAADLYNRDALAAVQNDLLGGRIPDFYDAYRNPPFFALLYVPFAPFDLVTGFALFTLFSLGCLGLALWILLRDEGLAHLRPRWRGLLVLVMAFPPVYFGLIDGENATLSLVLYALIYRSLALGQDRAAGVWAALGLFKPQLFLVFPLVFIARRQWRTLAWYAASGLALGGVSLLLVGPPGIQGWLRSLLDLEAGNAAANGWRMASLKSFFDSLLPGHAPIAFGLYALTSLWLLSAMLQLWRTDARPIALRWTFTISAAVLVNPHQIDYDLTILVAAAIVGWTSVPRSAVLFGVFSYALLLVRATVAIGDVNVQLTTAALIAAAAVVWRESQRLAMCADRCGRSSEGGPRDRSDVLANTG